MRNVTRGSPPQPLSWVTTAPLFKVHPSFLLPFFLFLSHERLIIWSYCILERKWSFFKTYCMICLILHASLLSFTLSVFLPFAYSPQKLLSKNRSHYMPLYTLRLFLTCTHRHINTTEGRECGGVVGRDQRWWNSLRVGRLDKNTNAIRLMVWKPQSCIDSDLGEYTPVPSGRQKEPLTHQKQGSGFLLLWGWLYIGPKSYTTR